VGIWEATSLAWTNGSPLISPQSDGSPTRRPYRPSTSAASRAHRPDPVRGTATGSPARVRFTKRPCDDGSEPPTRPGNCLQGPKSSRQHTTSAYDTSPPDSASSTTRGPGIRKPTVHQGSVDAGQVRAPCSRLSRRAVPLDVAELDPTLDENRLRCRAFGEIGSARLTRNERFRRGSDRARVSSFWVSPWRVAFGGSGVRRVLGCRRR
jgi:hypothetical protein